MLLSSLLGVSISPGTIRSMVSRCASKVGPTLEQIKELLIQEKVVNFDETGVRVNGRLRWVHNSSSNNFTYQTKISTIDAPKLVVPLILPRHFTGKISR